jgi:beta-galactosidase
MRGMVGWRFCLALAVVLAGAGCVAGAAPAGSGPSATAMALAAGMARQTINFDADWRFFKGEPPAPAPAQTLSANYAPIDPASFAFKDDAWRKVDLPHDWSIEGPFAENSPTSAAGGYLPSGVAWYRKTFTVPPEAKGKRVWIEFDGVMSNSEVYINKGLLGSRPNGYVPFRYDLTDYIDWGGPNLIAVRTDTSRQPASRWYTGAGIYRHVRLGMQNAVHIEHASTVITTTQLAGGRATVHVKTAIANDNFSGRNVYVAIRVQTKDGNWPSAIPMRGIAPRSSSEFETDISVADPQLWDTARPNLYQCVVSAYVVGDGPPGSEIRPAEDSETIPFGIRTAEFKADTGFWLNGKNLKLLGVALHSDAGGLGAAVPASAWETRLSELKKYGVNAVRTAHNPMPPEFYDACDKLGLLVMDEIFDVWTVAKEPGDYHLYFKDWWQRDLDAWMQRDRNHPSVVIWSLGNEIWDILPQNPDPAADQFIGPNRSIDIAKGILGALRDRAHELDPTRPVTVAEMRPNVAGAYTNGFADMMDVIGQNYRDGELAAAHRQNPARKIIGTENYKTRETWLALRDNPALSGQFLWAGVDYLGESGAWPNVVSPSGILDRTNWPRGEALEREAWWSSKPVVHLARMVTMPTRPGRPAVSMGMADWSPTDSSPHNETVSVYSNCEEVELFLNDKSQGSKPKDAGDAPRQWQVAYAPGTIKAVARNKGAIVGTEELRTAGAATKVTLTAERTTLPHDWDDVVYVRASVTDAGGIVLPNASNLIQFALTGPGVIAAVDNGDVKSHEPFNVAQRSAYQGTCVAILRATADAGRITVTASAEGLAPGTATIEAAPAAR